MSRTVRRLIHASGMIVCIAPLISESLIVINFESAAVSDSVRKGSASGGENRDVRHHESERYETE